MSVQLVGPEWGSEVASTPNNIKGADDARSLVFRADFEGHMGQFRCILDVPSQLRASQERCSCTRCICQATEMGGKSGAVYTAKFSRKGAFLASGSFDKTVRLWSWSWEDGNLAPRDSVALQDHMLNVADVSWGYDDSFLVSGACFLLPALHFCYLPSITG